MLESPVIGQFYRVPAIEVRGWFRFSGFVPVIGPEHDDAEIIKFPYLHYHVDWRFISKERFEYFQRFAGWPNSVYGSVVERATRRGIQILSDPVLKLMKCKRALPPYPHVRAPWLGELSAKFACAKLINGHCPHRGIHVSQMIRDGDILTCPGHGLRWNAVTGEAIKP